MPITEKEHKGKTITYVDFSDLDEQEMIDLEKEFIDRLIKGGKEILGLYDYRKAGIHMNYFKEAKELNKANNTARFITKSAVLGMNRFNSMLLNIYTAFTGENMHAFPTEEKAIEWLVS